MYFGGNSRMLACAAAASSSAMTTQMLWFPFVSLPRWQHTNCQCCIASVARSNGRNMSCSAVREHMLLVAVKKDMCRRRASLVSYRTNTNKLL